MYILHIGRIMYFKSLTNAFFLVKQTFSPSYKTYPWLGFKEESSNGAFKHMKSGTIFPGDYAFINTRQSDDLEGLALSTLNQSTLNAPLTYLERFPFCQLDNL